MAETFTLYEHEAREFEWTDRDLSALERLRNVTGVEILRPSAQRGKRVLRAMQQVGVVRLGNRTIQILPKIYMPRAVSDERQQARQATENLLDMLAYAAQLQIRAQSLAGLLRRTDDWFEILTQLFALRLKDEWQRGAYRNYQIVEEDLAILKGKWRAGDQLRRPERKHIFAIAHDEFSADNQLNRVFRFVTERLWKLTGDIENRQLLGDLRQWMDEVTLDKETGDWRVNTGFENPQDAFSHIKIGLVEMVKAVEEGRFDELDEIENRYIGRRHWPLRCKPLYLYFPDKFLPIYSRNHLESYLSYFGEQPQGDFLTRNRQLLQTLKSLPEFEGFDTRQMMAFLYDCLPPEDWQAEKRIPSDQPDGAEADDDQTGNLVHLLMKTCSRTRNVILYGPPGTGKTYWVRKFANHFLQPQLEAPPSEPQKLRWLEDLTWYEAIGLAMLMEGKERYKVSELLDSHIIRDFAALKSAARLSNAIWAQLQIHTGNSETVHYANRSEPFLFDKTQSAEWYLTAEGKEYLEGTFSLALAQLKRPTLTALNIEDFSEFVTFHQSFAYEEFVEGLRPRTDEAGQVRYEIIDGVFKRICRRAELDQKNKYLIVIDEINRANIAKVLGELITLLEDDKRMGKENAMAAALPYSGERFSIPENLYVIGTMNTADRSIALLDLALRRRFSFVEMMPDSSLLGFVEGVNLNALLARLNERITALLDRDHQIGHSYFMDARDADDLRFAWYHRVVPLVQEYFYNDGERLRSVLGDEFMKAVTANARTRTALRDQYDPEIVKYEIVMLDDERFLEALRKLAAE